MLCWALACILAVFLFIKDRKSYAIFHSNYWSFLFTPWKVVSFLIAATGMIVIAPYTGDPTWDYFDAFFMSFLTFFTAPWVIGVIYKVIKKEFPLKQLYVAFCLWMFSASWSYDLYILIRDGSYPITWAINISASSILYLLAGLLWNLDWKENRGTIFSFMEDNWPSPALSPVFRNIVWLTLPIMLFVAFSIFYVFLYLN